MTSEVRNEFLDLDFHALHRLFVEENERYIEAMTSHQRLEELGVLQARVNAIHEALRLKRIQERSSRYMGYIFTV